MLLNGILVTLVISINLIVCINSNRIHLGSKQKNHGQLIFANTLCRHGDRNIYTSYPNDPWQSAEYWPGGYYQLTNVGIEQHYMLGKYLRQRYANLLGNGEYSADKVYVRSTDKDRVLMSAQANLAGLFPPAKTQKWNENFDWRPIPVHTVSSEKDFVLSSVEQCDRFHYEMMIYTNSSEYKSIFEKHQALLQYMEVNSGKKIRSFTDICDLYDTLFIEQLKGKKLPLWADKVMVPGGDFEYLSAYYFRIFTNTNQMKKLNSGYLLKEMLDRFVQKVEKSLSPDRVLWMYFAHDNTIANMLNSLGLFEVHHPPYASCLFFELYKGEEDDYVQIFYKNSTETDLPALFIPNCGEKCSLHKFVKLYKNILPMQSFDKECALHDDEFLPKNANPECIYL